VCHGDVGGLNGDRVDDLHVKADTDGVKVWRGGEEAIIETTALAQAVAVVVKAKTWDEQESELRSKTRHSADGRLTEAAIARDEVT